MRRLIYGAAILLIATVVLAAIPTEAEAGIYEDTVRLHILAHSDEKEDQEVKIYIRDQLLSTYGDQLSGYKDAKEAEAALSSLLPEIEDFSERLLSEQGFSYGAAASLSEEWFDRREYADAVFPEGRYTSLIITLGEGGGKNWWCVMYPPLCLDTSLGDTLPYSAEEQRLIGGKYAVKLKSLELFAKVFR